MTFQHMQGAALVLGGTGAVGSHVCRLLAQRGSDVALTFNSNSGSAESLVEEITGWQQQAKAYQLDASDTIASRSLISTVAKTFGGIHSVIYAGGPFVPQQYLSETPPDQFRDHVKQELVAFYNVIQPSLEQLRQTKGSVVAVTTTANRRYPIRDGLSSGPKAGIESLVRAIAVEEGRYGTRANIVGPGLLQDGMAARLMEDGSFTEAAQESTVQTIPLRRFGLAEEVAEVAIFLASPAAAYVTGQFIDVDGGYQL